MLLIRGFPRASRGQGPEELDDETCIGWHLLHEEVFIEAHKRFSKNPDPEPPRPVAG